MNFLSLQHSVTPSIQLGLLAAQAPKGVLHLVEVLQAKRLKHFRLLMSLKPRLINCTQSHQAPAYSRAANPTVNCSTILLIRPIAVMLQATSTPQHRFFVGILCQTTSTTKKCRMHLLCPSSINDSDSPLFWGGATTVLKQPHTATSDICAAVSSTAQSLTSSWWVVMVTSAVG